MNTRIKVALTMLNPEFVRRLLGRSYLAQKTRALVLHDQVLTGFPRGPLV